MTDAELAGIATAQVLLRFDDERHSSPAAEQELERLMIAGQVTGR